MDIRFEDQVAKAVAQAVETFGGIDIVVNNASAISLTGTAETTMKKFVRHKPSSCIIYTVTCMVNFLFSDLI